MICAYHAHIADFRRDCSEGTVGAKVAEGFVNRYGYMPSESERTAWGASLPFAAKAVVAAGLDDVDVFIELQMPLSSARCDLLVVGKNQGGKCPQRLCLS
jgi:uncharacterized protein